MENKTCGECSWFSEKGNRCKLHNNQYIFGDRAACKDFNPLPKPTNLDMIRQMNDEDLIEILSDSCPPFSGNSDKCEHPDPTFPCKDCWREWLNAPAEGGGK